MKAILFDLDGTLIDTVEDICDSLNEALEGSGFPILTVGRTRELVGHGVARLILDVAPGADAETVDRLRRRYMAAYDRRLIDKTRPYPGMAEAVAELAKSRPLAVISNKPHDQTVRLIETLFPKDAFKVILGQREGMKTKPDPEAAFKVCEQLGIAPTDAVFVGDSDVDIRTGKNAGMKTIGCAWGFRGTEILKQCGADEIVNNAEELVKLLRSEE